MFPSPFYPDHSIANDLRCDNDSFLNSNHVSIDKMIAYLKKYLYFSPDLPAADHYSVVISVGEEGARLTHSHKRQYNFGLQMTPPF